MKAPTDNSNKKGFKQAFKDFWANKATRWTVIVFLIIVVCTIVQFVLMAAK